MYTFVVNVYIPNIKHIQAIVFFIDPTILEMDNMIWQNINTSSLG